MTTFFFVDEDGTENVSNINPIRHEKEPFWVIRKNQVDLNSFKTKEINDYSASVEIPKGTIKKLFGVELKWQDEPLSIEW